MDTAPPWSEILFLMVHGPDRTMHGRIRQHDGEDASSYAWSRVEGEPMPAFARGSYDVIEAWRAGDRLRIADPDGQVRLISDGTTAWTFGGADEPPRESPPRNIEYGMSGTDLLVRESAERWLGDDFTRPTGPPVRTTFLGRDAWAVELAPPVHKPHPMQLVIDAETGMQLQRRNDAFGSVREWTELTVGDELDPALFTWIGPVLTWEEQRARSRSEAEAEKAQHAGWVADHLGTRTLTVAVEVAIEVHHVEDDGSFVASISPVGSLLRRPRSDAPWEGVDGDGSDGPQRWTDGAWDWAVHSWEAPLAPGALADLQAQLHRR